MFRFRYRAYLMRLAHSRSAYLHQPYEWFKTQLRELMASNTGAIDFDERFYLEAHPDVRRAVIDGVYPCGYVHYCIHGEDESRVMSTRHLRNTLGLAPHMPRGIVEPTLRLAPRRYSPDLSNLPIGGERLLVVLISHLEDRFHFAGYSGFFADLAKVATCFDRVTVVVTYEGFNPRLVDGLFPRVTVLSLSDVAAAITERPSVVYCYDTETFYQARDIFGDLDRTIFYCQEYEAGFSPYGSTFARSEAAVVKSRNLVLSTGLLRDFLERKGLLSTQRVYVTAPRIDPLQLEPGRHKKVFFYFRPERFNSRNMSELVMEAVESFCQRHSGYELFLVGTVDTSYSLNVNGTPVVVLSKLSRQQYHELLASCDAVVALIYSAHPGVIAFQAAASGIPTVTNVFENRDATRLRAISQNIVPFDPVRDDLSAKLDAALALPRGTPSFNERLYAGASPSTLAEFTLGILDTSSEQTVSRIDSPAAPRVCDRVVS